MLDHAAWKQTAAFEIQIVDASGGHLAACACADCDAPGAEIAAAHADAAAVVPAADAPILRTLGAGPVAVRAACRNAMGDANHARSSKMSLNYGCSRTLRHPYETGLESCNYSTNRALPNCMYLSSCGCSKIQQVRADDATMESLEDGLVVAAPFSCNRRAMARAAEHSTEAGAVHLAESCKMMGGNSSLQNLHPRKDNPTDAALKHSLPMAGKH